ncbi:MAG: FtsX-like permease family protein, partial [Bacteroidia bacterium]|nr:FtsX-like permease family protein [Bacteroidia bacterium]
GNISQIEDKNLSPVLVRQASIYPDGRMMTVALKGINPLQNALKLPTSKLDTACSEVPILIGQNMARSSGLNKGDIVLLQWKDKNGTFDAANAVVADVFKTTVPTVDGGQIYISIKKLWDLTGLQNEASFLIANDQYVNTQTDQWIYKDQDELLITLDNIIATERISGSILYILLMLIALLAIFDTQVLSIFRRQKEIGTYMALGMTKLQVIKLFTVEGLMYSIFAMLVGCIWGIPVLNYFARNGIPYPVENMDDFGISISEIMYPIYGFKLIIGTVIAVVISATIVSYLPARKIARMDAVDAIKGKLQ